VAYQVRFCFVFILILCYHLGTHFIAAVAKADNIVLVAPTPTACVLVIYRRRHNGAIGVGRSQFSVHTDERTLVHSAQPSQAVTHPSTNRGRRALTCERATELALVATAPLPTPTAMREMLPICDRL
jgi:hypothetical protein